MPLLPFYHRTTRSWEQHSRANQSMLSGSMRMWIWCPQNAAKDSKNWPQLDTKTPCTVRTEATSKPPPGLGGPLNEVAMTVYATKKANLRWRSLLCHEASLMSRGQYPSENQNAPMTVHAWQLKPERYKSKSKTHYSLLSSDKHCCTVSLDSRADDDYASSTCTVPIARLSERLLTEQGCHLLNTCFFKSLQSLWRWMTRKVEAVMKSASTSRWKGTGNLRRKGLHRRVRQRQHRKHRVREPTFHQEALVRYCLALPQTQW
jgi:hypothetical protein